MVDLVLVGFILTGVLTILAALVMIEAREIVHSLFALVGTMSGLAIMFLLLGAEFVALVQALVYVGGITVIILFGVMLTRRTLKGEVEK